MKRHAGLACNCADGLNRLNRAEFVVRVHHADQHRFRAYRAAHIFRIDDAFAAYAYVGHVQALAL